MKRAVKLVASDSYSQILNVGTKLILLPLFVNAWGGELYGQWIVICAISSIISLFDLGSQVYFSNRLTESWHNRSKNFLEIISTGWLVITVLPFILTIFYLGVSPWFMQLYESFQGDANFYSIFLILALKNLMLFPFGFIISLLRGTGSQLQGIWLSNLYETIIFSGTAIVLFYKAPPYICAIFEFSVTCLFLVLLFSIANSIVEISKLFKYFNLEFAKKSVFPSLNFLLYQITNVFGNQILIVIFGAVYTGSTVAVYSTYRAIGNVLNRALGVFSHAFWPEITRIHSVGNFLQLRKIYLAILLGITLISLGCQLIVNQYGSSLIEYVFDGLILYDKYLLGLIVAFSAVNSILTWPTNILMATSMHKTAVFYNFIGAGTGLIIAYLLVNKCNLDTVFLSFSISFILFSCLGVFLKIDKLLPKSKFITTACLLINAVVFIVFA